MEFFIIILWITLGGLSAYYAQERGRNPYAWFFIGLFFGLIGLIALFMLPPLSTSNENPKPTLQIVEKKEIEIKEWYYVDENYQQQGPISLPALKALHASNAINNETLVWKEGMSNWESLKKV